MVAFVSSLISDIQSDFPNFAWWVVAYDFCCIIGVLVVVASDSAQTYHVAVRILVRGDVIPADFVQVVGFLAAGLVFCSSIINALVYSPEGPKEAAAAGYILLSMVFVS